jgi:hypothetical protein
MPRLHQIATDLETETELLSIKPIKAGFIKEVLKVKKNTPILRIFKYGQ